MNRAAYDAIVVGLGAMGSAALYQLSRRGKRVLGLEAFGPGHQLGSWHGESRVIRMAYFEHPNYVPLLRRAYEYPALHLQADEVALWEPRAGFLRPERCVASFVRMAQAAGAEARYSEPVRSWHAVAQGVEFETDSGRYVADQVVMACGARMSGLLGDAIPPIAAERIPLFWMQPSEPYLFELGSMPIYLWETAAGEHFYGFPHIEWPGVKVARHHSGEFCDADRVERAISAEDERKLRSAIAERIPALNGGVVSSLVCLYENSPDGHFLIDRLPTCANVVYAGGFSGHGFKFASVVGEILADLVTRDRATPDADFLRAGPLGARPGAARASGVRHRPE